MPDAPALPQPALTFNAGWCGGCGDYFTADQLRAYAIEHGAACRAAGMEAAAALAESRTTWGGGEVVAAAIRALLWGQGQDAGHLTAASDQTRQGVAP